jgi:hypothetical protein
MRWLPENWPLLNLSFKMLRCCPRDRILAPASPVMAPGELLVDARPAFLLQQSDEPLVRRNKVRLIGAEIGIESNGIFGRAQERSQFLFVELQAARLSPDLREKLRPRERHVSRDEPTSDAPITPRLSRLAIVR